ncbi:MAG: 2-hydroxychromene-2-carboxylate isomerase [Alphaproteobacteria bacterium]|nr:2-hydroxychromene-2-carboxylate isomerase [Alphaproteobacteria bacterium]
MGRTVEFLFDVVSPTASLAYRRLLDIAERTGAAIAWTPVFLGGIMNATGNVPPGTVPAKGKYMNRDLVRCAARFDIAFTLNPHFPVNTLTLQRAAVALLDEAGEAAFGRFIDACFQAIWVDAKNMGEPAVAGEVLSAAGFDADVLLARASDPVIKDKLKSNTDGAVARGVFGAPTFFVGDEMYFGQDRLDYVEDALGLIE